ncbi:MAG: BrnA antitoxin family protein [Treponema sp.]|jgi:uncharacterized protein (DUF4415 family)|nr:BrnA antitoxin family protein [Treponema sp.]
MKTFSYSDDNLPLVSEKDWMELRDRAGRISDDEIDYSDAPASTDFSAFRRWDDPSLYRPVKKDVHIKLDADLLVWLKSGGKGYQTRINALLRKAMSLGA